MGFLEDLKKRLSTPGAEAFSRERFEASRPGYLGRPAPSRSQTSDVVPPYLYDAAQAARRRRRKIIIGIGVFLFALLAAGGALGGVAWYVASRTVQKEQVELSLTGPERVTSGEDVTVRLQIKNASRVGWENVVVSFKSPPGFTVKSAQPVPAGAPIGLGPLPASVEPRGPEEPLAWAVGSLPARASTEMSVTGRLLGEEGTSALFSATVTLTPENRPEKPPVEKSSVASVVLEAIPVDLTIDVPQAAASGTPITVRIVYQNRTEKDLTGARFVLEAPQGFVVNSTTPSVSGRELLWDVPPLPPQGQGEIAVAGVISGDPETVRPFKAKVGFVTPDGRFLVAREVQRSLKIERAALSLSQILNNELDLLKVNPGTEIDGRVRYTNTGTAGLREVILTLAFEGEGLDARSVKVEGGFFDSRKKTMTWSAASTPALRALRPGESGEVKYTFQILTSDQLPFAREEDRNFALRARAVGDSPDLPTPPGAPKQVITDQFEILLNTVPSIALAAFYDDGRAGLPVSQGPIPPEVGKETIVTVSARLGNTSNEIIDATYRTVLPEGVRWVGKEYHTTGEVRYNERTRDVSWTVPLIAARAGVALPSPEFAFQVGITPSLNQVGSEVALTRGHTLEGTDAFTTARLRAEAAAVTTRNVDPKNAEVVR